MWHPHTRPAASGFTLIELLVVVAIIGMLASVILASLNNARGKARDARRQADIRNIQTALELYFNDHNAYPACTLPSNDLTGSKATMTCLSAALAPTYMASVPNDPNYPNASYTYDNWCLVPSGGGTQYYRLWASAENSQRTNPFSVWGSTIFGQTTCPQPT
jgi:type II secretion system protein G